MGVGDEVYNYAKKAPQQLVIGAGIFAGGYYTGKYATLYDIQESYGILKEIPAMRDENTQLRTRVDRLTMELESMKQHMVGTNRLQSRL
jgi:hypothetical protein